MRRDGHEDRRRRKRRVQEQPDALGDADGAQRLGEAQQMVVMRPDQVAGLDDRLQGIGKQLVDAAVAGELRPFELAQADLVVQHGPERAVGETAVEFVVVAAGQVDSDQGDRPDGMFGGADGGCSDLAAPAKPNATLLLQRVEDSRGSKPIVHGCDSN